MVLSFTRHDGQAVQKFGIFGSGRPESRSERFSRGKALPEKLHL
jgi:hypothetical protein